MAKIKYFYDPKTLAYRKIEKSWKQKLRETTLFLLATLLMALILVVVSFYYIDSPEEKRLKRELEFTKLQFESLNNRLEEVAMVLEGLQKRDDNIYRVVFEADPIPTSIRNAGFGGANRYKMLQGYNNSELIKETAKKMDVITKQLYVQSRSFDEVIEMAKKKSKMMASIPAIQPISNEDLTRMASGFGYRMHPIYKVVKMHAGMDFTAPTGTPIHSTGDGKVVKNPYGTGSGYGNFVVIDHGYGYQTLYAHMSKVDVKIGQNVLRGEIIGYVGNTGASTAPHLHYEVFRNGERVNPVNFFFNDLSPEEYQQIILLSGQENQSFD